MSCPLPAWLWQKGKVRANLLFAFRTQPRKDGRPGCHVQASGAGRGGWLNGPAQQALCACMRCKTVGGCAPNPVPIPHRQMVDWLDLGANTMTTGLDVHSLKETVCTLVMCPLSTLADGELAGPRRQHRPHWAGQLYHRALVLPGWRSTLAVLKGTALFSVDALRVNRRFHMLAWVCSCSHITNVAPLQSVMKRLNRYTAQHRLTVDTPPSALERDLPGLGH